MGVYYDIRLKKPLEITDEDVNRIAERVNEISYGLLNKEQLKNQLLKLPVFHAQNYSDLTSVGGVIERIEVVVTDDNRVYRLGGTTNNEVSKSSEVDFYLNDKGNCYAIIWKKNNGIFKKKEIMKLLEVYYDPKSRW